MPFALNLDDRFFNRFVSHIIILIIVNLISCDFFFTYILIKILEIIIKIVRFEISLFFLIIKSRRYSDVMIVN